MLPYSSRFLPPGRIDRDTTAAGTENSLGVSGASTGTLHPDNGIFAEIA